MNAKQYWKQRTVEADRAMWKRIEDYDKLLQKEFHKAAAKLDARLFYYLERLANDNGISIAEVKKLISKKELAGFHMNVDEYLRLGQGFIDEDTNKLLRNASKRVHISRIQAMQVEMQAIGSQLWGELEQHAAEVFKIETGAEYQRLIGDLARITGKPSMTSALPKAKMDFILRTPWDLGGKNFSQKVWQNRDRLVGSLRGELLQNALGVQSIKQAAENMAKDMDVSLGNAKRLVRTEAAAMRSFGKKAAYEKMGAKKYEYSSTLDHRTSDTCQHMDGTLYDLDDYSPGETAPPMHPH